MRLDASGGSQIQEMPLIKAFFKEFISLDAAAEKQEDLIQRSLLNYIRDPVTPGYQRLHAELSLRCLISHQIEQICIQLETQFGKYYGFTRHDLFPLVLDDDGNAEARSYQPLGLKILQSFNPERATLIAWTTRLVKQHREIDAFFMERGLCMRSDWAILNGTSITKLQRVLSRFSQLTPPEVEQATLLLESYHSVYRRDRLLQEQKGRCLPPTNQQLQEIASQIQTKSQQIYSAISVQTRLHTLADRLRQYRVAARGGVNSMLSLDQTENTPLLDQLKTEVDDGRSSQQTEFLQAYRHQFRDCLKGALKRTISDRIQHLAPPKDQTFLTALHLFHCKNYPMAAIAGHIGLKAQYQVTRLLRLKDFRADVRHWMLLCLQSYVLDQARSYLSVAQLDNLESQIEIALSEQIDALIEADQANSKSPKIYHSRNIFTDEICSCLNEQLSPVRQQSCSRCNQR